LRLQYSYERCEIEERNLNVSNFAKYD